MAVNSPYRVGSTNPSASTPRTGLSTLGLGGASDNPATISDWQFPALGAAGSFSYPTFGAPPSNNAATATPAAAAPATTTPTPTPGATSSQASSASASRSTGLDNGGGRAAAASSDAGRYGYGNTGMAGSGRGVGDGAPGSPGPKGGFDTPFGFVSNGDIGSTVGGIVGSAIGGPLVGLGLSQVGKAIANNSGGGLFSGIADALGLGSSSSDQSNHTSDTSSASGPAGIYSGNNNGGSQGGYYAANGVGMDGGDSGGDSGGDGMDGGDGGDGGGAEGHAMGGWVRPEDVIGRSPPPDAGYTSIRPGEFVVRANMARRYAPILEAINNGSYDPANPPDIEEIDEMSGYRPNDPDADMEGQEAAAGYGPGGQQDPTAMSPLMPMANGMSASPDVVMQRLVMLPTDQRVALAQCLSDPTVQGAFYSLFGPAYVQFIMAAQQAGQPMGGPLQPQEPDGDEAMQGGSAMPPGAMPGPGNGAPPAPHAMGGWVRPSDVMMHPPHQMHGAPPGVPPRRPAGPLSRVGRPQRGY